MNTIHWNLNLREIEEHAKGKGNFSSLYSISCKGYLLANIGIPEFISYT